MPVVLGLIALYFLARQEMTISRNGGVCNYSSVSIWLTVTESGRQRAYSLPSGSCTNLHAQDAEAIWGRTCDTDPCTYQAWKVGAGRFDVYNDAGSILRIKGWGVGSRWHITRDWPKPDLSSISYSLIR